MLKAAYFEGNAISETEAAVNFLFVTVLARISTESQQNGSGLENSSVQRSHADTVG